MNSTGLRLTSDIGHSAGVPDFETRIETIAKRPSSSQASTIIGDFYANKRRAGSSKRALPNKSMEIVLSSSDEDQEAKTSRLGHNGVLSRLASNVVVH